MGCRRAVCRRETRWAGYFDAVGGALGLSFNAFLYYIVQYIVNGGNYPYVAVAMLKESRMTLIGRFEGSRSNIHHFNIGTVCDI